MARRLIVIGILALLLCGIVAGAAAAVLVLTRGPELAEFVEGVAPLPQDPTGEPET